MNNWGRQREVEKVKDPMPPPRSQKQLSVAQLPEHQQDAAMDSVDLATERYPQVMVEGCGLHVCQIDGGWQVWLNTDDATFTGLCISAADTRDKAVAEAVATLEAAVEALQQPDLDSVVQS